MVLYHWDHSMCHIAGGSNFETLNIHLIFKMNLSEGTVRVYYVACYLPDQNDFLVLGSSLLFFFCQNCKVFFFCCLGE